MVATPGVDEHPLIRREGIDRAALTSAVFAHRRFLLDRCLTPDSLTQQHARHAGAMGTRASAAERRPAIDLGEPAACRLH